MAVSLTPRNQSGEEKNSADASDSFSSFTRINFILFGDTQREGKAKAKNKRRATDEPLKITFPFFFEINQKR